jgi:hypothetical protein
MVGGGGGRFGIGGRLGVGRGFGFEEAGITAAGANFTTGGGGCVASPDDIEDPLKKSVIGINLECIEGFCVAAAALNEGLLCMIVE